MIQKIENIKKQYFIPAAAPANQQQNKNETQQKLIKAGSYIALAGSLAGLAVWGYSSIKKFNKNYRQPIPEEILTKCRNWLQESAKIKSHIWEDAQDSRTCILNPKSEKYIEKLKKLSPLEKRAFVKEYCEMTGFPDLEAVSKKIENEILTNFEKGCELEDSKPLFVGYDINNSIGRRKALPGSDCDGLICITEDSKHNPSLYLAHTVNQRIINMSGMHYPESLSLPFLKYCISTAEELSAQIASPDKIAQYEKNLSYDGKSWIKAAQFNIDLASKTREYWEKQYVFRACLFVEKLRAGKILLNNLPEDFIKYVKNTAIYKYSNIARQEALQKTLKPKIANRDEFCRRFNEMKLNEKFEICRELFEISLGKNSTSRTKEIFEPFDFGDMLEMYDKISK